MARRKLDRPKTRWVIYLDEVLAFQVERRFMDPLTGRAAYAKRGQLIESLLRQWLADSTRAGGLIPSVVDSGAGMCDNASVNTPTDPYDERRDDGPSITE